MSQIDGSRKLGGVKSSHDRRTDDELLLATTAGDADAFAEFYRRHVRDVLGFLARRTSSYELAADLAGETFAAALLGCARYQPDAAPALAWLLGIAQNKLRESLRRGRVSQRARERLDMPPLVLDDDDLGRVEKLAGEGELALTLLDQLPEAQREAVRARVLQERSHRQIAAAAGCSEQVIRQHVSRGLRRLQCLIEEQR